MNNTIDWNEKRMAQLAKLWDEGLPITQIGVKMGVSRSAIAGKIHRMQLPKRTEAKNEKADKATPKPRPKQPEIIPLLERDNLPLKLALRNITWSRSRCSWPIGNPQSTDFHFCSKDVVVGKPYCNEHCFDAYANPREGGGS